MKVLVYTDPHLGLHRSENYTSTSLDRREEWCVKTIVELINHESPEVSLCLGDFFDRDTNHESTIIRTLPAFHLTTHVLAGNHDIPNRAEAASSLRLLKEIDETKVIIDDYKVLEYGNTLFSMVPHQLTNELYHECIERCVEEVKSANKWKILCLHSNFEFGFRLENRTINLTKEQVTRYLGYFHQVWIGHEHAPQDLYDSRVKIIGSLFPVTFSEMLHNRRYLIYDTETGKTIDKEVPVLFRSLKASELRDEEDSHYIEIEDDLSPGAVQSKIVRLLKESAFAVKLLRSDKNTFNSQDRLQASEILSLPEMVESRLKEENPVLLRIWNHLKALR